MKREASELVRGEDLDILIASRSLDGADGHGVVKLNAMELLRKKYGIREDDFISAELEAVPAYPARDLGIDRSMIGAYGQDDRVCVYTALTALFSIKKPKYTALTILFDKEETGSEGTTGALSSFAADFIADIAAVFKKETRHVLRNSLCLSADVIAAFDPLYAEATDLRNTALLNHGVVLSKYRGLRGKAETNDSSAEFLALIRRLFDDGNVLWQIGEVGKVDAGGGRTIARFIANLNIDTADVGVPLLSMHSPLEVASKLDIYAAHKAYTAFFERSP
jgi:aspartyl aminopeptidase